jgi:hypothetical protein
MTTVDGVGPASTVLAGDWPPGVKWRGRGREPAEMTLVADRNQDRNGQRQ